MLIDVPSEMKGCWPNMLKWPGGEHCSGCPEIAEIEQFVVIFCFYRFDVLLPAYNI